MTTHRPSRLADFFDSYTKDLTAEDLQRLFTRDTRDAYKFFTRGRDADAIKGQHINRRGSARRKDERRFARCPAPADTAQHDAGEQPEAGRQAEIERVLVNSGWMLEGFEIERPRGAS